MIIKAPHPGNVTVAIQRCGYARFIDRRGDRPSYTRRLGTGFYPRFHLYVEEKGEMIILKLHLDQKQPTYIRGHAHSGEYEGETVEREAARLQAILSNIAL